MEAVEGRDLAFGLLQGSLTTALGGGFVPRCTGRVGWLGAGRRNSRRGMVETVCCAAGKPLCGHCGLQAGVLEGGLGASVVNGRLQAESLPFEPPAKPYRILSIQFSSISIC